MSTLTDPYGFALTTMVEAQRGLSEREVHEFLSTGVLPDLSEPPDDDFNERTLDSVQIHPLGDVRTWLSGTIPLSITASSFLADGKSHNVSLNGETTAFKFNPSQPRDSEGQWTDGESGKFNVLTDAQAKKFYVSRDQFDKIAVRHYTETGYENINGQLNRLPGVKMSKYDKGVDKIMRSLLIKSPVDVKLFRGTTSDALMGSENSTPNDLMKLVDSTFTTRGWSSTTIKQSVFADLGAIGGGLESDIILEIEAPRGTLMQYVAPDAITPEEHEMVLAPGTRYRVLAVRLTPDDEMTRAVIRVRVEGQSP